MPLEAFTTVSGTVKPLEGFLWTLFDISDNSTVSPDTPVPRLKCVRHIGNKAFRPDNGSTLGQIFK